MTDDEWATISLLLSTSFAQSNAKPYDEAVDRAYRMLLGSRSPELLLAGITRLVNEGQKFLPTPGEIISRMDGADADPTVPTAPDIVRILDHGMWSGGRRLAAERGLASGEATIAWVEENVHPWAAAFYAEYGIEALRMLPINDPDYGTLERERLMRRYEEWLRRARERQAAGLPVAAGAIRQQLGMRRFDPLAALGIERPAELTQGGTDGD